LIIKFKKLRYKNFLSSGNTWTEIDLISNKTTLIIGSNGAGKSTLLDAIVFGLYGKPFRKINKNQIINSINKKDAMVELDFVIGQNTYMVRRGIKPNIFEIFKNGELVDQDASTREYQDYLEQSVLKLNLKSFCQIVILGSATYVPFMQLSALNRREVIEDLLDIQIFSTMNTLLKEKVSTNKLDLQDIKYEIENINTKIDAAKENNAAIKKIKESQVSDVKEKVKKQLEVIETETAQIDSHQEKSVSLSEKITDKSSVKQKHEKMKKLRYELESRKTSMLKEVSFYDDHDNCPTCKQGIAHDFKEDTVNSKRQEIKTVEDGLIKLIDKIQEVETRLEEISSLEDQINSINITIGEHRGNIRMAKSALASYKSELQNVEKEVKEVDESKILEYTETLNKSLDTQKKLFDDKEILTVVATMLKDGGIKTSIIKQYVPVMNKLINKYLGEFELFVDFQLDENFNEVIKSRYRDEFSYMSFSEGEKMRINLAILLTWRSISKIRNSVSTNLLIFDEIFDGALDTVGVESLIQVLNSLTVGDNIFVISHKGDALADKFNSTLRFAKVKNFSQIEN